MCPLLKEGEGAVAAAVAVQQHITVAAPPFPSYSAR